jgi:hypothetical protein
MLTRSNQFLDQFLSYDDLDVVDSGLFPPQYANLTKNSSVPAVAGGVLWQDEVNKVFWLYGGEFATAPSTFELWGYDVILNQWYDVSVLSLICRASLMFPAAPIHCWEIYR